MLKNILFGVCIFAGSLSHAVENDLLLVNVTFATWDDCERIRQEIAQEFRNEFEYGVPKGTKEYEFALKLVSGVKERLAQQQWLKNAREGSIQECKKVQLQQVGQ